MGLMDDPQDKTSAMIALLPIVSDWCKIELPHMTLVYAGELETLQPTEFNEMAKDAASLSMLSSPITLRVSGVETFGDTDKVDVLRFVPSSEVLAMRRAVEHWNASEFPFKPHATIGPVGSFVQYPPTYVAFDRIAVAWGDELLTFWLRR